MGTGVGTSSSTASARAVSASPVPALRAKRTQAKPFQNRSGIAPATFLPPGDVEILTKRSQRPSPIFTFALPLLIILALMLKQPLHANWTVRPVGDLSEIPSHLRNQHFPATVPGC